MRGMHQEIFRLVISVDQSSTFLANSRKYNEDRNNIVFLNLHSQHDGLRSLRRTQIYRANFLCISINQLRVYVCIYIYIYIHIHIHMYICR